jgi:hypothetical protein
MRSVTIRRVWKHVHETLPNIEVDQYGQMIRSKLKDPPFRYMVSYEDDGGFFVAEVLAIDELDAVKQFLKDK